jgi:drug/metabolite transporter (DMT)-like permease
LSGEVRGLSRGGYLGSYVLVLVAASIWGTTGVAARYSFDFGASPEGILLLRLALVAPAYLYLVLGRCRVSPWVIALGTLVLGPYHVVYYNAVKLVGVSTASLLLYTHPVVVALVSKPVLGEALDTYTALALASAVSGAAMVSFGGIHIDPLGLALATASSTLFALYVVLSKKALASGVEPEELALGTSTWALPTVALAYLAKGAPDDLLNPYVVAAALYLALVVTVLAYVLYMRGLRGVRASVATVLSTAEPLTATALSYLLFGEPLTLLKACGGGLILLAVLLVSLSRS